MRKCPVALADYLDSRVAGSPPVDFFLATARALVGVRESGKDNHGPLVELFQSAVSRPFGQSWCLDFVQACIAYTENRLGVQSLLPVSEACITFWRLALTERVTKPVPGDLIIWQLGATEHGHCGILTGMNADTYFTIEGNTSNSNEINANGDGVFEKKRRKGGSITFRELGFLRVFSNMSLNDSDAP